MSSLTELERCKYLSGRIRYDESTGKLYWIPKEGNDRYDRAFNARLGGKEIDSVTSAGYIQIRFCMFGKTYSQVGHRFVWYMIYGTLPVHVIDHINGNKADNRKCNLRDVEQTVNMRNASRRSNNTSGTSGIHKFRNSWIVQGVTSSGNHVHVASCKTLEDAILTRDRFKEENSYTDRHGKEYYADSSNGN